MFTEIIVPVDGSESSARALRPASTAAEALAVPLRIISYHTDKDEGVELRRRLREQLSDVAPVRRTVETAATVKPVADHIVDVLDHANGALVVMSTHGHGRSMAVIGSVATLVLERSHRPVLLIGPEYKQGAFRVEGPMVVAAGGSAKATAAALEVAAPFAQAFSYHPWVVQVVDPETASVLASARSGATGADLPFDSAGAHRAADRLRSRLGRDVDYEVVHDRHPGKALAEFANTQRAAALVMATEADHGVRRLVHGSDTAAAVRAAECPVLAIAVRSDT